MDLNNTAISPITKTRVDRLMDHISIGQKTPQNNKKSYSRLTEGLIRRYIWTHLRDVRFGGLAEANKMMDKLISGKKLDLSPEVIDFLRKNRDSWTNFAYKLASTLDSDALIGFFVPFVYGGLLSRKNSVGETIGLINIESNIQKTYDNKRFYAISDAINRFKRRGIGIIAVVGAPNEIYSPQMLSLYQNSKNECFIAIEREESSDPTRKSSVSGAYAREVLVGISRAKNVFIVLNDEASDHAIRSKALSSYGILHGICTDGNAQNIISELRQGSMLAIFDRNITFDALISDDLLRHGELSSILNAPSSVFLPFLASPKLPFILPELFEALNVIQYINSNRKFDHVAVENV